MKLSDIVINFLSEKNIDTAFTVSGGGCIHLIDSLRRSKISTFCVHHEQAALMSSEGYFRMNNKIAANIVTTGPGGTNTITGLLGLWLDSIPSIIISGQVQKSQLSKGTGCRQIGDQEFDIISVVKPMVKYAVMIEDPLSIIKELNKAYDIALSGRPGPVWIDIPLDMQGIDVNLDLCYDKESITETQIVSPKQLIQLEDLLNKSKKPLAIVGNGVRLSDSYSELNKFLSKNGIPVVTGPHSGVDCVDNSYEYYCGRIGILGQLTSNQIVQQADLLICLGSRLPFKMTGYNIPEFSPKSKKVIIDIDEFEIKKHKFNIDLPIVSDLKFCLKELNTLNLNKDYSRWQKTVKSIRKKQKNFHAKHKNLKDYASFYYLINKSPKFFNNTPIVTSNGTAHVITLQTYKLNKDQRLFTNVGCASMGYGLPAAIGACIANDKKPVICVEGDGSIMMNLQELQTIKTYNLPVKIILINNDGYLSIKLSQESFFKGQEFASGPANGVTVPEFKKVAKAFGIPYLSISKNGQINNGLKKMMNSSGPVFLEVFTHPKERHEPKVTHKGIDSNGKIIPGTLTDMFISDSF